MTLGEQEYQLLRATVQATHDAVVRIETLIGSEHGIHNTQADHEKRLRALERKAFAFAGIGTFLVLAAAAAQIFAALRH